MNNMNRANTDKSPSDDGYTQVPKRRHTIQTDDLEDKSIKSPKKDQLKSKISQQELEKKMEYRTMIMQYQQECEKSGIFAAAFMKQKGVSQVQRDYLDDVSQ